MPCQPNPSLSPRLTNDALCNWKQNYLHWNKKLQLIPFLVVAPHPTPPSQFESIHIQTFAYILNLLSHPPLPNSYASTSIMFQFYICKQQANKQNDNTANRHSQARRRDAELLNPILSLIYPWLILLYINYSFFISEIYVTGAGRVADIRIWSERRIPGDKNCE